MTHKVLLKLSIPQKLANEPVVYHLMRDFDLVANIQQGKFTEKGAAIQVQLAGKVKEIEKALEYLAGAGVTVEQLA